MKTNRKLIVCFLSFALLLGTIPTTSVSAAKKVSLSSKKITIKEGGARWGAESVKTITVKNTKKKVTWKILSGKKYITLQKRGKYAIITGKKKGKSKVQARVGKKKLTCTVTVKARKETVKVTVKGKKFSVTIENPEDGHGWAGSETYVLSLPAGVNKQDVTALKNLILETYAQGVYPKTWIDIETKYTWKNGRLTKIKLGERNGFTLSRKKKKLNLLKLDVSKFTKLVSFSCNPNNLISLKINGGTNLTDLSCSGYSESSSLSSLDVSGCANLTKLVCSRNNLSSLDVSKNVKLTYLDCLGNNLSSLDVSKNVKLTYLQCCSNKLSSLDLSSCVNLEMLGCDPTVTVTGWGSPTVTPTPPTGMQTPSPSPIPTPPTGLVP